jgi:hypothetical protein
MLHASVALARRVERAEIDFCALAGGVGVEGATVEIEAGGGRALYSRPRSPLNKVLGLGVGCSVSDADLDALERFYACHHSPAQIELCPLSGADLPARLDARGFRLRAFENELARTIDASFAASVAPPAIQVDVVTPSRDQIWVDVVCEGFFSGEHADGPGLSSAVRDELRQAMSQFVHSRITRYLAWIDGTPAGGAASYLHGGTLGIFGTATIPRFRRRGVQHAVALAALRDGSQYADLAIATTEPGSVSQRTFERLGFQVLYTRAILVKDLDPGPGGSGVAQPPADG